MKGKLGFNFSHQFHGILWNIVAVQEKNVILLEVRNYEQKQVTFSALNYHTNAFLWYQRKLEEPWWVTLNLASQGVILFTIYLESNNPDKKGILAYSLNNLDLLWWNNDFSLTALKSDHVYGFGLKMGLKEQVLDISTGLPVAPAETDEGEAMESVLRPIHYAEGSEYFETVKNFLTQKLNLSAVVSLEYLETGSCIFISCYIRENDLVNYLLVLNESGEVLLKEKIAESLQGIGFDTFFVLEGCLFFVKNKTELVSYKIL